MNGTVIDDIKNAFKKYNSKLYVHNIYNAGDNFYLVIAKFTPNKNEIEEDPYYLYRNGKVVGITITDSDERLIKSIEIMQPENCIYEID